MQIIIDSTVDTPASVRAYVAAMFGNDFVTMTAGDTTISGPASVVMEPATQPLQTAANTQLVETVPLRTPAEVFAASGTPPVHLPPATVPTGQPAATGQVGDIPWDARIHASTKTKNQNGSWKRKKGVSDELVAEVEAQLRALAGMPAPATGAALPPPVDVIAAQPLPTPGALADAANFQAPSAIAPAVEAPQPLVDIAPPPMPTIDTAAVVDSFATLSRWVMLRLYTQSNPAGKLMPGHVEHICKHYGIVDAKGNGSLQQLAHRPDYIQPVYAWLKQQIGEA